MSTGSVFPDGWDFPRVICVNKIEYLLQAEFTDMVSELSNMRHYEMDLLKMYGK